MAGRKQTFVDHMSDFFIKLLWGRRGCPCHGWRQEDGMHGQFSFDTGPYFV